MADKAEDILKNTGIEVGDTEALEELEKKFKAISEPAKETTTVSSQVNLLSQQKEELEKLLVKIDANLKTLKEKVKGDLDSLKGLKDTVEQELAKVKNLEATKEKVQSEIEKVEELKKKEESLAEEVKELGKELG